MGGGGGGGEDWFSTWNPTSGGGGGGGGGGEEEGKKGKGKEVFRTLSPRPGGEEAKRKRKGPRERGSRIERGSRVERGGRGVRDKVEEGGEEEDKRREMDRDREKERVREREKAPPVFPVRLMGEIPMVDWYKIGLKELHPLEVARQMTLLDTRSFQNIRPSECLKQRWTKRGLERGKGCLLSSSIDLFLHLTSLLLSPRKRTPFPKCHRNGRKIQ